MKRLLVLICFLLSTTFGRAQKTYTSLYTGTYTYVEFTIRIKDQGYPIVFATIIDNDSIYTNQSNIELFLKSLYSINPFVPISNSAYQKAYMLAFGHESNTYNKCSLFISEFNSELLEKKHYKEFTLLTGEKVSCSYITLNGIFMVVDKESFWAETLNSLGVSDPTVVNNIVIPISIVDYIEKEHLYIVPQ